MVTVHRIKAELVDFFFHYSTPKIVRVQSKKISVIHRLVQFLVAAYVIGYTVMYKKGYQSWDFGKASVTTKVKGVASTLNRVDLPAKYRRVWDTADYVVPAHESEAFFIMTNAIITENQTLTTCADSTEFGYCDPEKPSCRQGVTLPGGNGVQTGRCVLNVDQAYTCEIHSWCPVENDFANLNTYLLTQAQNFTVLIKNNVEFSRFQVRKKNIVNSINNVTYLKKCQYHLTKDPFCPIFGIGYMVELASANFTEMAINGGVIGITITWDCDFDLSTKNCFPQYQFSRLDDADAKVARGWNFRQAYYYRLSDGRQYRDLIKAFGILFVFTIDARAGKFDMYQLTLNIGAGFALFGIATVLSDFVLIYVLKDRHFYKNQKIIRVEEVPKQKVAHPPRSPHMYWVEHV